jgi:hypothetical protein
MKMGAPWTLDNPIFNNFVYRLLMIIFIIGSTLIVLRIIFGE